MRNGKWRKGTKRDAVTSTIAFFVVSIIFLAIGLPILILIKNIMGIIFAGIGLFFIYKGVATFVKHVIQGEPYEYYIHVKAVSSHYKGSQVGLPDHFDQLTPEQNDSLERGQFPRDSGYNSGPYPQQNHTQNYTQNHTQNYNNHNYNNYNNFSSTNNNKTNNFFKILPIFAAVFSLITFIPFIIMFVTNFVSTDILDEAPIQVIAFIALFSFLLLFAIGAAIRRVFKSIKNLNSEENINKNEEQFVEKDLINKNETNHSSTKEKVEDNDDPFARFD
ncbi:MAG: hypothetical protein R3Y60_03630 [bacterium]